MGKYLIVASFIYKHAYVCMCVSHNIIHLFMFASQAWGARQAGPRMKELFDPSLLYGDDQLEMEKCMEIGLLCTQYDREDRPTMLDVLEMLDGNKILWTPKKPAYLQKKGQVRQMRS